MSKLPAHLSAAPADPYEWRESVLSTRSLSYLSTADAMSSPSHMAIGETSRSRSTSANMNPRLPPTRQSTEMTDDSEYSLEMGNGNTELKNIPELPESVADCPLFVLPREIRDRIYGFCLTARGGSSVEWPSSWDKYGLEPRLLRTCKIIYGEAATQLYSLNNMTFHHPSDANMFVRAISSPLLARYITSLSLHIRAQDTRLWMPYITSMDGSRSLKADFPRLRDLHIRFRSNKWQHSLPPEANMKLWHEDSRLEELIDSLGRIFSLDAPQDPKDEREFDTYMSNHPGAFPLDPSDPDYRTQWLTIQKARSDFVRKRELLPTIKITCACRVHSTHFNTLTTIASQDNARPRPDLAQANNGTGVIQQSPIPPVDPPAPVREGEPFRGFTPADLRHGVEKLHDPELGTANMTKTPFAHKNGILLALEIHCLDPKRDNAAEQRSV